MIQPERGSASRAYICICFTINNNLLAISALKSTVTKYTCVNYIIDPKKQFNVALNVFIVVLISCTRPTNIHKIEIFPIINRDILRTHSQSYAKLITEIDRSIVFSIKNDTSILSLQYHIL